MSHSSLWINAAIFLAVTLASPAMSSDNATISTPLDWMAGHWCADSGGKTVEEIWLPPRGGMMVGLGRTHTTDRTVGFEFLRIAEVEGVQSFIAQPGGRPPTHFARTAGGEDWVRFENPEHDFPQRIEYRRDGDNLLTEVGGPGENDEEAVFRLVYSTCETVKGRD